jgi:hypothetical protein
MSATKNCSNCQKTGLPSTATLCSQCGSALIASGAGVSNVKIIEAFRDISVLKGQNTEYKGRIDNMKQKIFGLQAKILAYWLLFLSASIIGIAYANSRINHFENIGIERQKIIDILEKRDADQDKTIATFMKMYKYRPSTIYYGKAVQPVQPLINEVIYVVETGDDLETVSTFFFGNTLFAHNIGADNGLKDDDKISPEQKLRIRAHY